MDVNNQWPYATKRDRASTENDTQGVSHEMCINSRNLSDQHEILKEEAENLPFNNCSFLERLDAKKEENSLNIVVSAQNLED